MSILGKNSNSLTVLQSELSGKKFEPLSVEETRRLLLLAKTEGLGSKEARTRIIESNMRLVYSIVSKFLKDNNLYFCDYFNEGVIGLMSAIDKFEPSQDTLFSVYATRAIMNHIRDAYKDQNAIIRLPNNIHKDISAVSKAQKKYLQNNSSLPSEQVLAKLSGLPLKRVKSALELMGLRCDSLDRKIYEGETSSSKVSDMLSDDNDYASHNSVCNHNCSAFSCSMDAEESDLAEKIQLVVSLAEKECTKSKADTLKAYCELSQEGYTLAQIADILGISANLLSNRLSIVRSALSTPKVRNLYQRYAA